MNGLAAQILAVRAKMHSVFFWTGKKWSSTAELAASYETKSKIFSAKAALSVGSTSLIFPRRLKGFGCAVVESG